MAARYPQFYPDDPAPDEDEVVTPRHLWAMDDNCLACLKAAAGNAYIERGEEVDPAKFRLCHDHLINVAMSGGHVVLDVV